MPGQAMYSGRQSEEWTRNNNQQQQQPGQQRPPATALNSVNPGNTPMRRPETTSIPSSSTNSRASSFFASFRKNSNPPDPNKAGNTSPVSPAAMTYHAPQGPHTIGPIGQRRPDTANWDEYGKTQPSNMLLAKERPTQALTQGRVGSGPAKLISPRVQAVQAQSGSHSASNSISSTSSSLGRRGSSFMKNIVTRDAQGEIHPEIQQVVGLTLAHSGKIYSSGPLVRRIERNADGSIVKDAKWAEVWAQLGGTTLSVWDMEAIKRASEEGREEPPTYINVTDSVSVIQ